MLFNTSYKNKEFSKESNVALGSSFSFSERIKLGGIGSSRLVIEKFSPKLRPENMQSIVFNYANIELRPKGIIIHFANKLDRYSWIVPYYSLVVFSAQTFSIHSNGDFIQFKKNKNYIENKKFIAKLLELKVKFSGLG